MAGLKNLEILNTAMIQGHSTLILELEWKMKHRSKYLRIIRGAIRYEMGEWLNFNLPAVQGWLVILFFVGCYCCVCK